MDSDCGSFVHNIQIATPCKANWDEMTGDEKSRFCQACKLNVYNIADMTLDEAETLISTSEGRVCVRLYRRPDGTVITKDCPVGLKERLKKRAATAGAAVAAMAAIVFAWISNQPRPTVTGQCNIGHGTQPQMLMGSIAPSVTETPIPMRAEMGKMARQK